MTSHRVGHADVVITAPLSVPYLSHVPRQAAFASVRDDLHARAMAVLAEDGTAMIMISVDLIGVGRGLVDDPRQLSGVVRDGIAEQTQVPAEAILITATHAHSTPETTGITTLPRTPETTAWLADLVQNLIKVGVQAVESATPASLHVGRVAVSEVATIRRLRPADGGTPVQAVDGAGRSPQSTVPSALADLGLSVLVARHTDGTDTVAVNFACHPVALSVQPEVSADYPGALVAELANDGTRALFLQGVWRREPGPAPRTGRRCRTGGCTPGRGDPSGGRPSGRPAAGGRPDHGHPGTGGGADAAETHRGTDRRGTPG